MKVISCIPIAFSLLLFCRQAVSYNGNLDYVICDIKRPLAGLTDKSITADNYKTIIDGLKNKLQCNTIRTYIDLSIASPDGYSKLYKDVYRYAREIGLKIYANPLGTGRQGLSNSEFVQLIDDYANYFQPDFLGPFNESGIQIPDMEDIAARVRSRLQYPTLLVGPDTQKVENTINKINGPSELENFFDIVGSHNADHDDNATVSAWQALSQEARRPIWASENPRHWSVKNSQDEEIGVASVVGSNIPVNGLVIYLAFPNAITEDGVLTQTGQEIADGIGASE